MAATTGQLIFLTLHSTDSQRVLLCLNQTSWHLSSSFHFLPSSTFNTTRCRFGLETKKRFSVRSEFPLLLCLFFCYTWNTPKLSHRSKMKMQSIWILLFKKQIRQFLHHHKVRSLRRGVLYSLIIILGRCCFPLAFRFCRKSFQKSQRI